MTKCLTCVIFIDKDIFCDFLKHEILHVFGVVINDCSVPSEICVVRLRCFGRGRFFQGIFLSDPPVPQASPGVIEIWPFQGEEGGENEQ